MTSARFALVAVSVAALLVAASASGGSVVFGSPLSVQQTQAVFARAQLPVQDPLIPVWRVPDEIGISFMVALLHDDTYLEAYRSPSVELWPASTVGGYAAFNEVYVYPSAADARYDELSVAQRVNRMNAFDAKISKEDVTPTFREPIRIGNVVFLGFYQPAIVATQRVQNALSALEGAADTKRVVYPVPPSRDARRVVRIRVGETKTFDAAQLPAHKLLLCNGAVLEVPKWSTLDSRMTDTWPAESIVGDIHLGYRPVQHGKRLLVACRRSSRGFG